MGLRQAKWVRSSEGYQVEASLSPIKDLISQATDIAAGVQVSIRIFIAQSNPTSA